MGLETARRALNTQQAALHTTGHNIANANTPGFSRQRVNFTQTEPFPKAGFNRPDIPGQLGTGVSAGSVQRIRENFLDVQFRNESSKHGYWDARHTALQKIEDIMNEPTDDGLANNLDRFWTSLQDLSVHPEDSGARSVVRQRGIALAETFNYTAQSLKEIQRDMQNQIDVSVNHINSLARQINNINKQIASVEPHGYLPNDLYDQRDLLVDELSKIVNIKVEPVASGGQALDIAEGKYTIKLIDDNGRDIGVTLVDGFRLDTNDLNVVYDEDTNLVTDIFFASKQITERENFNFETSGGVSAFKVEDFAANGKFKADVEAYGYITKDGAEKGLYPDMLNHLDQMVYTFVEEFNAIHRAGWNLNEIQAGQKDPVNFFEYKQTSPTAGNFKGAASNLQVSAAIRAELNNIAASASPTRGTVYDRMADINGEKTGPSLTGIYTGSYDNGQLKDQLFVRYDEASNSWSYTLTTHTNIDDVDPASWQALSGDKISFNGINLDISTIPQPTEGGSYHIELEKGTKLQGFSGDGSNALALSDVKDALLNFGGSTTNIQSFYQGVIGNMAVDTNEAERMMRNSDALKISVDQRRESVSSVSLDEEMTNLIQFQHAYNAAARTITLADELLERIVNGLGLGGR